MTVIKDRPAASGPWTYERLRAATAEDTERRELIDGWLYLDGQLVDDPATPVARESARPFHGDAVRELVLALGAYREHHPGQVYTAPLDVAFDGAVCQPDVFWLPHPAPRYELPIRVLPELVIEVSSPSTRRHDLVRKRRIYERSGVPEYWFVDTDAHRVECYHLDGQTYPTPRLVVQGQVVRSVVLDGFDIAVDDILGPDEDGR